MIKRECEREGSRGEREKRERLRERE